MSIYGGTARSRRSIITSCSPASYDSPPELSAQDPTNHYTSAAASATHPANHSP